MATTEEQRKWVPKITKSGFEKTKIPSDVYAMLLWEYERKKSSLNEDTLNGQEIMNNQIVNNKKKAKSSIRNMKKSYTIKLRF